MKKIRVISIILVTLIFSSCNYLGFGSSPSHARIAASLRAEKRYEEAIKEYEEHIQVRLEDSDREPEENPYFYLIMIGDIYLEQGNINAAIDSFAEAQRREVEKPLVVDRIRRVAGTLKNQGRLKEAVDLLRKYRELDEFAFDMDIDECLKEIVRQEDLRR